MCGVPPPTQPKQSQRSLTAGTGCWGQYPWQLSREPLTARWPLRHGQRKLVPRYWDMASGVGCSGLCCLWQLVGCLPVVFCEVASNSWLSNLPGHCPAPQTLVDKIPSPSTQVQHPSTTVRRGWKYEAGSSIPRLLVSWAAQEPTPSGKVKPLAIDHRHGWRHCPVAWRGKAT